LTPTAASTYAGPGGWPGRFGQQSARVRYHDGIVVHVADPRAGDDFTRGLVHGRVRGKPGPEVEKLPNALPSGPGDGPADKTSVVMAGLHLQRLASESTDLIWA
jgi:hypothetical protein